MPGQRRPPRVKPEDCKQRREDGEEPFAVSLDDHRPVHGRLHDAQGAPVLETQGRSACPKPSNKQQRARRPTAKAEEAGAWFETDLVWSPDGTRIAFDRWRQGPATLSWDIQPIGIVSVDGGPVVSAGPTPVSDGAWFDWSPDGTSIVSLAATILGWPNPAVTSARPIVIDAATGDSHDRGWTVNSATSWQRLVP